MPRPTISWFGCAPHRRVDAREHAGVGERDQCDGASADQRRDDVGAGDPGDGEAGQALRERTEDRHTGACREVEYTDGDCRAHHGDQDARQSRPSFVQQNHRQREPAHHEGGPVDLSLHQRRDNGRYVLKGSSD